MRELGREELRAAVCSLATQASYDLPADVEEALREARRRESGERGRAVLDQILKNAAIARDSKLPICQDTGLFSVFLEIGPGIAIGCDIQEAVDAGLAEASRVLSLRPSIVAEPLRERRNTGDNTPASLYLHASERAGTARLIVMPKGGGSENVTTLVMSLPTASEDELRDEVARIVVARAPYACPPVIVGVGLGGSADGALALAKRALLRPLSERAEGTAYARLESDILRVVNASGVGPGGLGGDTTALAVAIERAPTHMACLPVGVSISCHALRRKVMEL
ncbi:MAG: fumarate hydratase [Candidatus Geothermincolia bacterium]